jgi:lipid-A-disaccharide synthase
MRAAKRLLVDKKPDLLILIDFPDFNLHLAAFAKKQSIPVLYYISPQIWAWRQGRVKRIKRLVDHMAVILPFEAAFYQQHGVPVTFVGHPLMDQYTTLPSRPEDMSNADKTTIGLLPGSRDSEVYKLLPAMLAAAKLIRQQMDHTHFLLSQAPSVSSALVDHLLGESGLEVGVHTGATGRLLDESRLVIVASGTTTLEAAVHGTPMIIVYRVSPLSYLLGKALIRVPHIGLVNLIAGKRVAPELIQHDASPADIARQALALLRRPDQIKRVKSELTEVKRRLGSGGASDRVAQIAMGLVGQSDRQSYYPSA